jgi:membrane protease YdiL (CAAX protease family)
MKEYESSLDEMEIAGVRQSRSRTARAFGLRSTLKLFLTILILILVSSFHLSRYTVVNRILISEWLFIFTPCLVYFGLFRVRPSRDLKFLRISAKTATGIVFASISGILLTGELVVLQNEFVRIPPEYLEMLREQFSIPDSVSFPLAAFAFAVSPAICEELLFRGIILQSLVRKVATPWAIILTGLLFGLFHLDPYRLLGTTVLGIIMGAIMIRAMSLLAPIFYHLVNNMIVLLVMNTGRFREIPWLMEEAHIPPVLLVLTACVFIVSLKMIRPRSAERGIQSESGSGCMRNISADDP